MDSPSMHSHSHQPSWRDALIRTPLGWVVTLAAAAAGVYLLLFHLDHVFLVVPYLLLMACPLMHLFMHHGHGHKHDDSTTS